MAITGPTVEAKMPIWQILSFFTFISPLPVLWLGLGNGFTSAYVASGFAALIVLLAKMLGAPFNVLAFLQQVLLILVLVRFSLLSRSAESGTEWYPMGRVLAYLVGISAGTGLVAAYFNLGHVPSDEELRLVAKQFANTTSTEEQFYGVLQTMKPLLYGISANVMLVLVILNGILAQRLLGSKQQHIRPSETFQPVSLPVYYLWGLVGAAVIFVLSWGNAVGMNLLIVLCTGLVITGLSFIHEIHRLYKLSTISLVVFYVVMVLLGWLIVLVALLGLVEPWLRPHLKSVRKP